MKKAAPLTLLAIGIVLGASARPAAADAIAPTGQAKVVTAPASLAPGAFEDDAFVNIVNESKRTLTSPLGLWTVDATGAFVASSRPKDECVESHMLHADRKGTGNAPLTGAVRFSQPVLGVEHINTAPNATLSAALDSTDPLFGLPGVSYAQGVGASRGSETAAGDSLKLVGGEMQFHFEGDDFDEVRVITGCDPQPVVPEVPLSIVLPLSAAAVLGGAVLIRRRAARPLAV